MGTEAGEVTDIEVRADDRMTAQLAVRQDFVRFIGTDSRATIKKTLGVAGDALVEISGRRGQPLDAGALIETTTDRAISEVVQETLEQIRNEVLPTVRVIRLAAEGHVQLAASLNDPEHPALKALEAINSIVTEIDKGDGLANRMLTDKRMADDVGATIDLANTTLNDIGAAARELRAVAAQIGESTRKLDEAIEQSPETVRQVNATLEDIRKISGNLIRVTAAMPATIDNINNQVKSLSGVIVQTQATLREIQRLTEAAQRHWLIRRYVEDDQPSARIAPQEVIVTP